MLVSQVEPAGQHAEQVDPAHRVVPAGQLGPRTSQVVGFRFEEQRQAPRGDAAGQQVLSLSGQAPLTHVHVPAEQLALSWQRLPQPPQLRGSLRVLTHFPPHRFLPPLHFFFRPFLLLFFLAAASSPVERNESSASSPLASPARIPRREGRADRERAKVSKRSASISASFPTGNGSGGWTPGRRRVAIVGWGAAGAQCTPITTLNAGRAVRKGQNGTTIVATVMCGDDGGKVVNIKPGHVFDVSQTDERTARAAA